MKKILISAVFIRIAAILMICSAILWVYIEFNEANKIKELGKGFATTIAKETKFNYRYDQINKLCASKTETLREHNFNDDTDYIVSAATSSCIAELQYMKNYLK